MTRPDVIVDDLACALRPLEVTSSTAWWDASTHATDENDARRVAADRALSDFLADSNVFAQLGAACVETVADPAVARQLDLLQDAFLAHQVPPGLRHEIVGLQASIESAFARHRGVVGGLAVDDNAIRKILRSSNDVAERRDAWEASKSVGAEVADQVRQLARLRNRGARMLGFSDYFALALATSELDYHRLMATLGDLDRVTKAGFQTWKAELDAHLAVRFATAADRITPWHYDDPFLQSPPVASGVDLDPFFAGRDLLGLTVRTFDGLGLDIRPVAQRSDLYPRDAKNQHAFCVDLDREGDVRVLSNVTDNGQWMETLLHEFGHAAYFVELDRDAPWLLRTMHPLLTEGVAMLFGRLTRDPDWLTTVAEVAPPEVERLRADAAEQLRAGLLAFARWVLVMTNFERGLYGNPERDLDTYWWDLVEHYQLVRRPPGRVAPDWAAKIHVAVAPVYYQNYLYGEMFASQLGATLRRERGGVVDGEEAGAFLRDRVFRPGSSMRWDRLVEQATGAELTTAAFGGDLGL